MTKVNLDELGRGAQARANAASSGRSAETVTGGHTRVLRQTLIALTAGSELSEHESPGEATLQVLSGTVELTGAGSGATEEGRAGDLLPIPPERHSLRATTDAVVLLTVAKLG